MFRGFGTVLNVATVVAGAGIGLLLGHRLPQRTRDVVTDGLGLTTLLIAALSAAAVLDADLVRLVGTSGTVLVVLGALAIGGVAGSLLRIEARLESLGATLRRRLSRPHRREGPVGAPPTDGADRRRFVEGFVTASLVFCVGPLTILGSLSDGLGLGYQQLALKAALDGFAAVAFAASFGWGVMASALVVGAVQGTLTVIGLLIGGRPRRRLRGGPHRSRRSAARRSGAAAAPGEAAAGRRPPAGPVRRPGVGRPGRGGTRVKFRNGHGGPPFRGTLQHRGYAPATSQRRCPVPRHWTWPDSRPEVHPRCAGWQ